MHMCVCVYVSNQHNPFIVPSGAKKGATLVHFKIEWVRRFYLQQYSDGKCIFHKFYLSMRVEC